MQSSTFSAAQTQDAAAPACSDAPPLSRASARWLWPLLAIAGVAALLFALHIAGELLEGESFRDDAAVLLALRHPYNLALPIGPRWMTQSAIDLSALGGPTLLWLLGGAGLMSLIYIGRRAEAAWLGSALIGASLVNAGLKVFLHRPRPEVVPHLTYVSNASFPSGHAMISAAVYLTLGLMLAETQTKLAARAFIVAFSAILVLLIGSSRVYLGVHWPSDVLAGWCFGAVWALGAFSINRLLHGASLRATDSAPKAPAPPWP